ncbi:MAG: hypothetical protein VBE63_15610 [Lamprobacter sp.]|uniref:hypothetical protein n=1 Tax=Lamprobacter sp. TaxID=3100796 RepID=UPI002B263845|nr:hypothetical protein [Lamprobacter sp.]MEA3641350.1 hypothetical protein [Lamprobacter sp.]
MSEAIHLRERLAQAKPYRTLSIAEDKTWKDDDPDWRGSCTSCLLQLRNSGPENDQSRA